jgi:hypothetical protein
LKSWHQLVAMPENLRRAVLEMVFLAVLKPDQAVSQYREANIFPSDDSLWIGNRVKGGIRWQGHAFFP